jgi:Protein of unknown function (DUF3379)
MDKKEAKELLRTYRPGTSDDQEPRVAEALQMAQHDQELAKWFEGHRQFNAAMRNKLKEMPVPADLKEKILLAEAQRRGKIIPLRKFLVPLAAAAAVVLLALGAWYFLTPQNKFADYRDRVVRQSQRGYVMDMWSTNLADIHSFLMTKQCPDYALPQPLVRLPAIGCASNVEWRDHKVSMVCLKNRHNQDLYLFVLDRQNLDDPPASGARDFAQVLQLGTESWTEGDKVYILAGRGDESELQQYLE